MYRILIVSDDTFLRDMVRLSLADMRAEVQCAGDAGQMTLLCRSVSFDLVIVLRTGELLSDGGLVRRIRPTALRRPAVFVVAWQQAEQTVQSLLESGVNQYITLPVSLHRLRMKVADELKRAL